MENHTEKIREAARRLYLIRKRKKELEQELKEIEKNECREISNYMFSNDMKSFEVLLDGGQGYEDFAMKPVLLRITKSKSKKVTFIAEKLKERLSKELYNKVVTKRYEIKDFGGLKKYLRSCGVDPKVFKKFITVTETVDHECMERLYDLGDIDIKKMQGCYEVKESKESILTYELKQ